MAFEIQCPNGGQHILMSGTAPGTVCIAGLITDAADYIKVRLFEGSVGSGSFGSPDSSGPNDGSTTPVGQYWCVANVSVPGSSNPSGIPLTVAAWSRSGSNWSSPQGAYFYGGGTNPRNCCSCSGCPDGLQGLERSVVAEALDDRPELDVAISDGPHAGLHRAQARGPQLWHWSMAGVSYQIVCEPSGAVLLRSPTANAACLGFEKDPFFARFPGDLFGASSDVVVTAA